MGRSRITNGRSLMPRSIDGRSVYMRRFRDVFALLVADAGGEDRVTEAIKSMARRAATITVELERYECIFADSQDGASPNQLETYQRLSNTLRRLLETIGIDRKPRDITPSIRDYMKPRSRITIDHDDGGGD
jgi:hypothetical protein